MSDAPSTTVPAQGEAHVVGDVHAAHGPEPEEPLGTVDLGAWAVAVLGGAIGVLVAVALFAARA